MRAHTLHGRLFRLAALLAAAACSAAAQMPIVFDTDMGNDIDDALALAMLHSLTSRGECRLVGVTLTNASPSAVPYVRMVNRFYGRGELPVGVATRHIPEGEQDVYLKAALKSAPPAYLHPEDSAAAEASVTLLRRLLAASAEKLTIVQVGFSTNLAMLLDSPADNISPLNGAELAKSKVASLVVMAGNFVEGKPEYNVKQDVASARAVFDRWPTPVVASGFEIGRDLMYPARSIEHDFGYAVWHPIAASYRAYRKMPYDRPTWDLTAALIAVRPEHRYFRLSSQGTIHVQPDGTTKFDPGAGSSRYLILDPAERTTVIEALTLLASEPPHNSAVR